MPLSPVTFERFGGLRLSTEPGDVGTTGATDMLNVDLAVDGSRVFTRAGSAFFTGELSADPLALATTRFSTGDVMLATGDYTGYFIPDSLFLDRIESNGSRTGITTWLKTGGAGIPPQIAVLGTPTSTLAFFAYGGVSLVYYDGTITSFGAGKPAFIATTPFTNRLAQAWYVNGADSPTGSNGSRSTVFFSDKGDPLTYSANNYVHLQPGDGEDIVGMISWREYLFVFKESRVFVFYGESDNPLAPGTPVFNYRQIPLPTQFDRITYFTPRVTSTNRGVYFVGTDAIYRTTGSGVERVSDAIDSLVGNNEIKTLSSYNDRVFVQTQEGYYILDERTGQWMFWVLPGTTSAPIIGWARGVSPKALMFASENYIMALDPTLPNDAGTPIVSRYRMGVADLGSPTQKVMREILLAGSGTVDVSVATDWQDQPAATSVTLGTSPAVREGRSRTAVRGRNFQVQIASSTGPWALHRATMMMRSQRAAGVSQ